MGFRVLLNDRLLQRFDDQAAAVQHAGREAVRISEEEGVFPGGTALGPGVVYACVCGRGLVIRVEIEVEKV